MKKNKTTLDHVIGVEEAGRIWELSPGTVKNYCNEGKIICKKIGKTWVVDALQPNPKKNKEDQNDA